MNCRIIQSLFKPVAITAFFFFSLCTYAQTIIELPIWEKTPPISNGYSSGEIMLDSIKVTNISKPTIKVYIPKNNSGTAVIDCPGGGYAYLGTIKAGLSHPAANWFNEHGVVYIALKYRTPHGHASVPLSDAEQAIRVVRQSSKEWGIDPAKVGIMGTSAGGHLASTLATRFHDDSRPDFQILVVPVISMIESYKHEGSCNNLMGRNAPKDSMVYYSSDLNVTINTPKAFIALNDDDAAVPSLNGTSYYMALKRNGVSAEMHIFPKGGHTWLFNDNWEYKDEMQNLLSGWLYNLK